MRPTRPAFARALAPAVFLAVSLTAAHARADEEEASTAAAPAPLPTRALHLDAYGGYTSFQNSGGGTLLGADVLGRWRFLQAGLLAEFNTISSSGSAGNVNETVAGYAAAAGLGIYRRNFAMDALLVVGVHDYQGVGTALATNGASCDLGFAGLRGGFSFVRLRPVTFGLWGYINDDLARTSASYTVEDRTPGAQPATLTANFGEWSYGGGVRLGLDLEL
jgi:hypothetical protein